MKMFKIRVNGHEYEVEVEEISSKSIKTAAKEGVPAPAPRDNIQKVATRETAKTSTANIQEGVETILAPMPGTIVDVNVEIGEKATRGQTLLILEAMKMENEILAPHDCTVTNIHVARGTSVNAGDILIVLS